jgi:hypothetical protein
MARTQWLGRDVRATYVGLIIEAAPDQAKNLFKVEQQR